MNQFSEQEIPREVRSLLCKFYTERACSIAPIGVSEAAWKLETHLEGMKDISRGLSAAKPPERVPPENLRILKGRENRIVGCLVSLQDTS